ncbi:uncharacterized protein B0I36DRAFT_248641 [Microdochium trichocladiopsis]|uniref:Tyrosinase copper-binding domain-containing protein n=1 Tax=Microdochium trichocladiopsis TaxID=1682393 RepID=A0A9P8XXZ3_9PEZI|nr:uncharacterized protein B0I36DRAFT_248641 [Microdochium trichocladiopsis]KAH7025695.1 hypothetical protein B0I36DRAFT_248641 [Microdochium trichocladiopsis]
MSFEEALQLAAQDKQTAQHITAHTPEGSIASGSSISILSTPPNATESEPHSSDDLDEQDEENTDQNDDGRQGGITDGISCLNPRIRVEWRNLADEDKRSYVRAVRCLMDKPAKSNQIPPSAGNSVYVQLAWVHVVMAPVAHGTDLFLPWHRYYMLVFEQLLRDECGYRGPLPWWDETRDMGNFAGSGLFTDEYFGELPEIKDGGVEPCITTGVFANTTIDIGSRTQSNTSNSSSTASECVTRGEHRELTGQVHWGWVELCEGMTQYTNMRECVEQGLHAYGHNGLGRVMSQPATSVRDAVFFVHHSMVDWQWKRWHDGDREGRTTLATTTAMSMDGGAAAARGGSETVLSSRGLYPDLTVADVLDTENYRICYRHDYS